MSDRSEAIMGDKGVEGEGPLMNMHLSCFGGSNPHYNWGGARSTKVKAMKKFRAGYEELWQRLVRLSNSRVEMLNSSLAHGPMPRIFNSCRCKWPQTLTLSQIMEQVRISLNVLFPTFHVID